MVGDNWIPQPGELARRLHILLSTSGDLHQRGAVQNLLANPQFYRPPHIGKSSAVVAGVTPATSVSEPGSAFKRKTVEEIIKDWNSELQDRAAKFRKQATAIAEC
ncbi:hypothetical protein J5N97_013997 [Dioscorea zingiberensis]|uniref:Nucleoporin NSP1-like C-terminal domain-containing protein n=1 Tax=Dioscorea zingiberensis TaxID=325984 RepID=A0A9D5CSB3_9LILI|nr:hypothetical protein J5N97_013997 [Dioscorea zingiberensis]